MSYNISSIPKQEIKDLVIPASALTTGIREGWKPKCILIDVEKMQVEYTMGCGQVLKGFIKDGNIHVSDMDLAGEGSGSLMYYVMQPAFEQSKGTYKAIMIWEGGDSTTKFTSIDGEVTKEKASFEL